MNSPTPRFDYDIQVWTRGGIVQMCGHPVWMRKHGPCCNAARFAGQPLAKASAALAQVQP